ncbi:hypothetical protein chiPu_0020977 [Chiloscyllium punctatum]|uniref:Uncharacterized protein n=1 Tax=Chiloscyllium punctatum TaxID=137246 RepID=A0A401RM20_CHIPU|nr:hypothetical protein [Chiloscyllium punctatum]
MAVMTPGGGQRDLSEPTRLDQSVRGPLRRVAAVSTNGSEGHVGVLSVRIGRWLVGWLVGWRGVGKDSIGGGGRPMGGGRTAVAVGDASRVSGRRRVRSSVRFP